MNGLIRVTWCAVAVVVFLSTHRTLGQQAKAEDEKDSFVNLLHTGKEATLPFQNVQEIAISNDSSELVFSHVNEQKQMVTRFWNLRLNAESRPPLKGGGVFYFSPNSGNLVRYVNESGRKGILITSQDGSVLDARHEISSYIASGSNRPLAYFDGGRTTLALTEEGFIAGWKEKDREPSLKIACALRHHFLGSLAVAEKTKRVAAPDADGLVGVWSLETLDKLVALPIKSQEKLVNISFSPDGDSICYSTADGYSEIWDIANYRRIISVPSRTEKGNCSNLAVFSPHHHLVFQSTAEDISIRDSRSGLQFAARSLAGAGAVRNIIASRDCQKIAILSSNRIRIISAKQVPAE